MKHSLLHFAVRLALLVAIFVGASPVAEKPHTLERRITSSAPHFVAYWDAWLSGENGPPDPSQLVGFNNLILAFLLSSGAADQAQVWASLDDNTRSSISSAYSDAGINILVGAFGSTEAPTSSGSDPTATANTMAAWVKQYNLGGIDIDYEDFAAMDKRDGSAENWLIEFTRALRAALPAGQYIVTHAPVGPWFSPAFPAGYTEVHKQVGSLIDWYNVQFYNQGSSEYTTCSGLLTSSSSTWPSSSVFEIQSTAGVELSKIVIGKPGTAPDAANGYIDTATFASCLAQGKSSGWDGGVMVWQFPHVGADWISQVRASSWPVSGTTNPPPTTTTNTKTSTGTYRTTSTSTGTDIDETTGTGTSTSTGAITSTSMDAITETTTSTTTSTTTTTGGVPTGTPGSCVGVAAWSSSVSYVRGSIVTYDAYLWRARRQTTGDVPGGSSRWVKVSAC